MAKQHIFSITKKDLQIDFFSGTGAGGQHRNKHQNCVRIRHPESGAAATGQSSRERKANIAEALQGLVKDPKFKIWQAGKVHEVSTGKSIEQRIDETMAEGNLKIEGKDESGRWIILP